MLLIAAVILAVPAAWAEVDIKNHQMHHKDNGIFYIIGELENNLNVPVQNVRVTVQPYSADGTPLDSIEAGAFMRTIIPDMKSPFEIIVRDAKIHSVHSYDLDVMYEIGEPKSQVIDIESSQLAMDRLDNLIISGSIVNRGDITANGVSVVATLYGNDGNVVAVSRTFTEPDYLRADDRINFTVLVPEQSMTDTIASYSLAAESEEYASIPEFPAVLVVFLAGLVGICLLTRQMRYGIPVYVGGR